MFLKISAGIISGLFYLFLTFAIVASVVNVIYPKF